LRRDRRMLAAVCAEPGRVLQRHRIRGWRRHNRDQWGRTGISSGQTCGQRLDRRTGTSETFGKNAQRHGSYSSVMGRMPEMNIIFINTNTTRRQD
jgi:hypothetical protein